MIRFLLSAAAVLIALAIVATALAQELPPMPPPEFNPVSPLVTPEAPQWPRAYLPVVTR